MAQKKTLTFYFALKEKIIDIIRTKPLQNMKKNWISEKLTFKPRIFASFIDFRNNSIYPKVLSFFEDRRND
ncbi:hypothetical protein AYI68_g3702 [Smittium mucronatum]|uniref:Uncharacterized protein n=1 Tax=Smittium mucronatum TaxID=133383 RepID=A0A1R0GZ40_9FUNG|nr:hypothetical protein AYI68_g3702 [Smittium mucronatum]